jgi:SAM-dependent methyltransferase
MLLDNKLHLSPLPKYPKTILDLGTGTGIWAVDMAELYPSARIIGVDLFPLQTKLVPPNVRFKVRCPTRPKLLVDPPHADLTKIDNVEVDWRWGESIFDFIHARELTMTIYDWPNLIQEIYRALKPGAYFEVSGFVPDFRSDDGTLPKDSAYVKVGKLNFEIAEQRNVSG